MGGIIINIPSIIFLSALLGLLAPSWFSLPLAIFVPFFYMYGSIPFAHIFTYILKGEIIYEKGSRNVGVANTFMIGGLPAGFLTVAGETSKAVLPMIVANLFFNNDLPISLVLIFAALFGTNFSMFLKGKGGMGSTILMWTLAILSPYSLLSLFAISVLSYSITRDSHYTSIIARALLPIVIFLIERNTSLAIFALAASIMFISKYDRSRDDFEQHKIWKRLKQFSLKREHTYVMSLANLRKESNIQERTGELQLTKEKSFRIPERYVITSKGYEVYASGSSNVMQNVEKEISRLIDEQKIYSVRLPQNIEDLADISTLDKSNFSNLRGSSSITRAVEEIWHIAKNQSEMHPDKTMGSNNDQKIETIIEEAIDPKSFGVVFTRNPVSGMSEVIVESFSEVEGVPTSIEKPDRWIYKWGVWLEMPENKTDAFPVIKEVVTQAKKIESIYGKPLVLDWSYDGRNLYWLKLDEINRLRGLNVYSSKMAKERLPGMIKPLVWSVTVPLVNSAWKRLFVEFVGKDAESIDVNNMAKPFYYRAYFNMGIVGDIFELLGMPRESLELILGAELLGSEKPKIRPGPKALKYAPRMAFFALDKANFSKKIRKFTKTQTEEYAALSSRSMNELNETETLQEIDKLCKLNKETAYFIIATQLLMSFHNMLLNMQFRKFKIDPDSVDLTEVSKRTRDISLEYQLSLLHEEYEKLPEDAKSEIRKMGYKALLMIESAEHLRKSVDKFLTEFGHLSDSNNDFSKTQWKENPDLLVEMISTRRREIPHVNKQEISNLSKNPLRQIFLRFVYNEAVRYREHAERISFLYTNGYALFRPYFLFLGKSFKEKGFIDEMEDIFYLTLDEVRLIANQRTMPLKFRLDLEERKEDMVKFKDAVLPETIIGDNPPPLLASKDVIRKLKGIAASRGYYEGKIRVIQGTQDFSKVKDGDVLAIPYSDVSWTPLLAKAKAVVSESGGMLSHCSIVAREFGIPAVVSAKGAMQLKDNTLAAVDGYTGEVLVLNQESIV